MIIKIETKTVNPFCKNSIIIFSNLVPTVPLSQVRFKLKVVTKLENFTFSEEIITISLQEDKVNSPLATYMLYFLQWKVQIF